MASGLPLVLLLSLGAPQSPARAELDAVATRIEQLKARHAAGEDVGRELLRLLVRAQELAVQIDSEEGRAPLPPPAIAPAGELRERADALHDEADRIAGALVQLEARIAHAHRAMISHPPELSPAPRALGGPVVARNAALSPSGAVVQAPARQAEEAHIRALMQERARLVVMLAQVRAQAAALEAEAQAAEQQ